MVYGNFFLHNLYKTKDVQRKICKIQNEIPEVKTKNAKRRNVKS